MELTGDQIIETIIESIQTNPEIWEYDDYNLKCEELDCSVWISNGLIYTSVMKYERGGLMSNYLQPSFKNCIKLRYVYYRFIRNQVSLFYLYYSLLILPLGLGLLFTKFAHSAQGDTMITFKVNTIDFDLSKNYYREQRLKRLLNETK